MLEKFRQTETIKNVREYFFTFAKWTFLGILTGLIGGAIGAAFSKAIHLVTELRAEHQWLIYLLPIGGLAIVSLYKLFHTLDVGTDEVFEGARTEKRVPLLLAPAVFLGSVITHLCGGSAGREGAALQLGGSVASALAKVFKLSESDRHIIIMCGMSGVFSAVFGTPLCAAIFAIEVISVGYFYSAAVFPCITASVSAYVLALKLGIKPESFKVMAVPELNIKTIGMVVIVAISGAIVSILFCKCMHLSAKVFRNYFKNPFLRTAVGGIIIAALTFILNTTDYNGAGINVIERIFEEEIVRPEAFLLKIIFTAITVGAGFKGGEIVPTLFIGAALGGVLSSSLGLGIAFGAALGIAALFCGVTNCPIATVVLCLELFGGEGILFYAIAAFVSFLLSGKTSLYKGQKVIFSKLSGDICCENIPKQV